MISGLPVPVKQAASTEWSTVDRDPGVEIFSGTSGFTEIIPAVVNSNSRIDLEVKDTPPPAVQVHRVCTQL